MVNFHVGTGAGASAGAATDADTDAADVDTDRSAPDLTRLKASLNKMCGPEIVVRHADFAPPDFDSRHSAKQRTYRYHILNQPESNPFRARFVWHLPDPLDVPAMNQAAAQLLGQHDFSSFCRRAKDDDSLIRRVLAASWSQTDALDSPAAPAPELTFEITASAFCHQMVRSLVGTLVEVGQHRRAPDEITAIIAAQDRHAAGNLAPPQGLTLWQVGY